MNNIAEDYDQKVKENFMYRVKGSAGSYRIYSEYGSLTGGIPLDHWAHKDKTAYYVSREIDN